MIDIDEQIGAVYAEYFNGDISEADREIAVNKLIADGYADSMAAADRDIAAAKAAGYGNDAMQYRIDQRNNKQEILK